MKGNYIIIALFLLFLSNCKDTPKAVETKTPTINFVYTDLGIDSSAIPHTILSVNENGTINQIDTFTVSLSPIEKEKYAEMQIPADAIEACGGWFAGGGDYFYVINQNGRAVVYQGFLEEQQTDEGYHWRVYKPN